MIGLAVSASAAGCFLAEEQTSTGQDEVVEGADVSAVLKSTLILDSGCSAAKVGPRHLLISARCVAGNAAFAAGKTITFKAASELRTIAAPDDVLTAVDAGAGEDEESGEPGDAGAVDSGKTDGGKTDAGASSKPANKSNREATIEEVKVHASYTAKCAGEVCAFGALAASDAKDIALIILDADLETIPTIPVDLDSVGQSDTLLAVGSGCEKLDGTPVGVKTFKTHAVPAKSVNHAGSPYLEAPELVTRLGGGYVVTPGQAWRSTEAPRLCKTDIGAPLFRGGQAAVAGVTSNFTTFDKNKLVPVTVHHTKVDTLSKVGPWLASLGAETTHSCSEAPAGCVKKGYDGGAPSSPQTDNGGTTSPGDAGADAIAPKGDGGEDEEADAGPISNDLPDQGEEAPLPESSEDDEYTPTRDDSDYDAGPKKKKKKAASGCSAAPGTSSGSNGLVLGLGLVVAAAIARRRRSA